MADYTRPSAQWPDEGAASPSLAAWSFTYDPVERRVTVANVRRRGRAGFILESETSGERRWVLVSEVNGEREAAVAYQDGTVTLFGTD